MRTTLTLLLLLAPLAAGAQIPNRVPFTARLTDNGVPLTGAHTIVLRLFDAATSGSTLWAETHVGAGVDQGLLHLELGDTTPLTPGLFAGDRWLELTVDATTLSPRLAIGSVPFALNAATLGGTPASGFAPVNHSHAYLPVGGMLSCPAGQKVIGLTPSGNVTCGAEATYSAGAGLSLNGNQFDVSYAGSGTAASAARSDHDHSGAYLPVGATLSCTGSQKMTGISADGSVTCGADVDTNTTYSAGAGLTLSNTTLSVAFGGTGTATTAARSDHRHAMFCPAGFATALLVGGGVICWRAVASAAVTWQSAARGCLANSAPAHLCRHEELLQLRQLPTSFSLPTAGYWMGDRTGDNLALITNINIANGTPDDFDGQADITMSTGSGYVCCLTRDWP